LKHQAYTVGFALDRIARAHRLGVRDIQEAMLMATIDRAIDEALESIRDTLHPKPKIEVVKR